ncbi:flagellar biosynthesis protein FlhB [Rhodoplanes elegans]|uniref:Flagellar biosynthetic protein FlhB n=1 Tax=Rhodoplanes elegans TaxID=29408 RepID=A0A327KFF6_9BRAD|nr:flagellar biosynthesis protein FlhB [Rhodoplanes elegans]MBK5957677.1 flagellar biosynthesis protein FlhB [Rhodoplanes elegans]RAI37519.1 flagellar biosynthesis protein FlhB [Rhodoplanes elegans]
MAEDQDKSDKTEDPTQRRLDQALEHGDVVKSQEVSTWFVIGGGTLALAMFGGSSSTALTAVMKGLIAKSGAIHTDGHVLVRLTEVITVEVLAAIGLPFLLIAVAALAGNALQHRLVWTTETLTPKLSKISPMAGFKRLFSAQALANFVKGLLKLGLVGTVLVMLLWPERNLLEALVSTDPTAILPVSMSLMLKLLGAVVAIMAVIAGADYLFQYQQWYQRQKMSLKEIKDEYKETEGDPKIKAKIRQLRIGRMRKRMMAAVPGATVVITNPTHYAVALKYERGMNAPVCLAKGTDRIALKIREVATEAGVPIVENPPLARALHATVEIDREVPPEHYKAVAEVVGYVMRLKKAWR